MSTGDESNAKTNEKPVQRKANTSFVANTHAFGRPDYPYFRDWIISWLSTVAIRTSEEDPVHHFRLIRPDLKIWNAPSHPICILRRFQCLARLSLRRLPPPIQELLLSTDRVRCKLQYSRATRSDMKNICRFSIKITFFFPLARAFPPFLPPSSTHLCNFQFLVVGVTT